MQWFQKQFIEGAKADFCHWWNFSPEGEHVLLLSGMKGRYSFWGFDPLTVIEVRAIGKVFFEIVLKEYGEKRNFSVCGANAVLDFLNKKTKDFQRKIKNDFPLTKNIPFRGGLMGFLSYDFGTCLENIGQKVVDDVGYPAAWFIMPRQILIFDHEKKTVKRVGLAKNAEEWLKMTKSFQNMLKNSRKINEIKSTSVRREGNFSHISSNLTLKEYLKKVARVKDYLQRGHTYQVNFSQRFSMDTESAPWEIFQRVTKINPSPYQVFMRGEDFSVISNSPERLVKVFWNDKKQRLIETRPIKGTMPRSANPKNDEINRRKLLASKKDEAELTMIVDLQRNDIGKICGIGSVEVTEHRIVEGYSHVWHTVSNVRGILEENKDFRDVIKAVFPGGSITGCPKKRTMEIIDELEDFSRGVYTGSAGYLSFDGAMDFNIMIRTMFWRKGRIYFHSGGGIVIDSKAKKEYEETLDKAGALMESLNRQ